MISNFLTDLTRVLMTNTVFSLNDEPENIQYGWTRWVKKFMKDDTTKSASELRAVVSKRIEGDFGGGATLVRLHLLLRE